MAVKSHLIFFLSTLNCGICKTGGHMQVNHQFSPVRKTLIVVFLITSLFIAFGFGNSTTVFAMQPPRQILAAPEPSIYASVSTDFVTMEAGWSVSQTYSFTETSGGGGDISAYSSRFYTQTNEPLSDHLGPYVINIPILPNETTTWENSILLPREVVDNARMAGEYVIVHNRTFYGTSSTGLAFSIDTSFKIVLPPDSFSKILPSDGSLVKPLSPALSWASSIGAYEYKYCIDTTNNDHCDYHNWFGTYGLSGTHGILLPNTTYYWQVRAYNFRGFSTAANSGVWWSFTTLPYPPSSFEKSAPPNNSVKQPLNPTLSWSASTDTTEYLYCLDKETINNGVCNSSWVTALTATSVPLSGLDSNTTYYWQVRARGGGGTTDADGGTWWKFTTVPPPGAFGKSSPAIGSLNQPLNPTLSWSASTGVAEYLYCLDKETLNNSTCDGSWVSALTVTSIPLSGLSPNTTYFWQVRARNTGGITDADNGTWWSFKTAPTILTTTLYSQGSLDGWILESTETSNVGGTMNSTGTTFNLGDGTADKQYRSILSFNTGALPDTAVITKVTLKIKVSGALVGNNNPFSWGNGLKMDVCRNNFGTTSALQLTDFNFNNTTNCKLAAGTFGNTPILGWYSANMISTAWSKINKVGLTQFRLRFNMDDNNDGVADYWRFYSGNYSTVSLRPTLVVWYYVP